jgi:DNA-binding GntR family transcriptional regulator
LSHAASDHSERAAVDQAHRAVSQGGAGAANLMSRRSTSVAPNQRDAPRRRTSPARFQPIASASREGSLVDAVQASIGTSLKQGNIPAGTRLIEAEIADALRVSRTPVREALRRLEAEGLVQLLPNRGFIAADLLADVDHVFLIRERLEGLAASLAAREITVDELEKLTALQTEMETVMAEPAPDVDRLVELNHAFHTSIGTASRSPRLMSLIARLHPEYVSYQVVRSYDKAGRVRSIDEHRAILDALWRRDAVAVDDLVQGHFERGRAIVVAEMRQRVKTP